MNREILRLAVPNIISNISVPLLSSVDTALMGRLSEWHIGAVGLGSMIFNFAYWNFGFLRMGTTGITAQANGSDNLSQQINTLGWALSIALLLGVVIILLREPLADVSIYLMDSRGRQAILVRQYFLIRVWAAPATLSIYALIGWFFGMQNAIYPLIVTVFLNSINIVVSFYLVRYAGMDVDGVAWGTVAAQYFGLALGGILMLTTYRRLFSFLKISVLSRAEELVQFLKINSDIFIRTLCLTFAFGFFYRQSAARGELLLAVNVILLQFLNWMSYGVDGFAYAAEALVGKYAGAKNQKKIEQAVRLSLWWGMALAAIFSLIYTGGGAAILKIFTNQQNVIQAALPFLFWMGIFPIAGTPSYIWDGIFVGLTASKSMRNSMILSLVIYLSAYFIIIPFYPNHGLWLTLILFLAARGVIQWWMYHRRGWHLQ